MTEHPSTRMPPEKRAALYRTASAEFAEHGFTRASLNRIIAAVGMSKSSFYHYFENKTDLFRQTLDSALAPFIAARDSFDLDQLDSQTFWPEIREMTSAMALMANRSPELLMVGRMFYRSFENPGERELTRDIMDMARDWMQGLIARGQELGLVRRDLPPDFMIDALMALGTGIDRWFLQNWEKLSETERLHLNDQAFDLLRRLMVPMT
ncbi:MAG: TetR/AcrR family transcriptional regulator [Rhodobacteraceae bacterium]|nr:TetR/AcrR family transcriptional regulator [Paracoccaceae bacterium]